MEDISRELEKEIAQSKPAPLKYSQKKRILIVDEFGGIKSGGYFKPLTLFLLAVAVVQLFISGGILYRYSGLARENEGLKNELGQLKGKADRLLDEKEVLMARLMLLGKEPDPVAISPDKSAESLRGEDKALAASGVTKTIARVQPDPVHGKTIEKVGASVNLPVEEVQIEKFTISQNANKKRVKVRFEIYNKTKNDVDISGRIFVVLKPKGSSEKQWASLPMVGLNNGVPVQYRKGQYFSISRFKPVNLKLDKSDASIIYTDAVIYIYNDNGQMIYTESIHLPGGEQN